MTSKTAICNKALRRLGVQSVLNIDTDNSRQATECKAVYDDLLEEVLREHNWNFAKFRQTLAKDETEQPFGLKNRFPLPTTPKFIKLIKVQERAEYTIENGYIFSDAESIELTFIGKETDTTKFDPLFVDAFALRIAIELAFILTGESSKLTEKMERSYTLALSKAKYNNLQNQTPIYRSRFTQSRFGYNYYYGSIDIDGD